MQIKLINHAPMRLHGKQNKVCTVWTSSNAYLMIYNRLQPKTYVNRTDKSNSIMYNLLKVRYMFFGGIHADSVADNQKRYHKNALLCTVEPLHCIILWSF